MLRADHFSYKRYNAAYRSDPWPKGKPNLRTRCARPRPCEVLAEHAARLSARDAPPPILGALDAPGASRAPLHNDKRDHTGARTQFSVLTDQWMRKVPQPPAPEDGLLKPVRAPARARLSPRDPPAGGAVLLSPRDGFKYVPFLESTWGGASAHPDAHGYTRPRAHHAQLTESRLLGASPHARFVVVLGASPRPPPSAGLVHGLVLGAPPLPPLPRDSPRADAIHE